MDKIQPYKQLSVNEITTLYNQINRRWKKFLEQKMNKKENTDIRFLFLENENLLEILYSFGFRNMFWKDSPFQTKNPEYVLLLFNNEYGVSAIYGKWNDDVKIRYSVSAVDSMKPFNTIELSILQSLLEEFQMNEVMTKLDSAN